MCDINDNVEFVDEYETLDDVDNSADMFPNDEDGSEEEEYLLSLGD